MEFVINDETTVQQLAEWIAKHTPEGEPNPILFTKAVKLAYRIRWPDINPDSYFLKDASEEPGNLLDETLSGAG